MRNSRSFFSRGFSSCCHAIGPGFRYSEYKNTTPCLLTTSTSCAAVAAISPLLVDESDYFTIKDQDAEDSQICPHTDAEFPRVPYSIITPTVLPISKSYGSRL